jgi:hypothetical protein
MSSRIQPKHIAFLIASGAALFLSGCASTTPKASFTQEIARESRVAAKDQAKAIVTADPGLDILDMERTRIAQRIEERVAAKQALNAADGEPKTYSIELRLTRYQKGNAFARAMLAGLGQIHIDGVVSLFEMPAHRQVGAFTIKKTFAWGGIYGGSTSMEDIERTFADGVAAAVTGQAEDEPKKEKK